MLIDFIEINNVFDNPDEIVEIAKQQQYFTRENHSDSKNSFYVGLRSNSLDVIDQNLYHKINNEIFTKCTEKLYDDSCNKITYGFGFQTSSYFHILTQNEQPNSKWRHKDPDCIWAGVIYLNKNPRPNSGTVIERNGKDVIVDNEYNKLVMYAPTHEHTSQGGFGEDINDCRLTLTFFINAFQFKIKSIPNNV
jgi:hypothetical protein